ncbi:hypothetical protein DMENIID0001_026410 [Sergentomyia squamirostris]
MAVSTDKLKTEINAILKDADLSVMSAKKVRQILEEKLNCNLSARKKEVDKLVMDYVNSKDVKSESEEEEEEVDSEEDKGKKKRATANKKPAKKRGESSDESESGDDKDKSDDEYKPQKGKGRGTPKGVKRKKTDSDEGDSDEDWKAPRKTPNKKAVNTVKMDKVCAVQEAIQVNEAVSFQQMSEYERNPNFWKCDDEIVNQENEEVDWLESEDSEKEGQRVSEVSKVRSQVTTLKHGDECYRPATDGTVWHKTVAVEIENQGQTSTKKNRILHQVRFPRGQVPKGSNEFVSLFLREIISRVMTYTNAAAEDFHKQAGNTWKPIDESEMYAFIGLQYMCGIFENRPILSMWDKLYGINVFRATMGLKRFIHIQRFLRFNKKVATARDKLGPVTQIWDIFNSRLTELFTPGENLILTEQTLFSRGGITNSSDELSECGMKIFYVLDSANQYPLKGIPYFEKKLKIPEKDSERIAMELVSRFGRSNRNVICNESFTTLDFGTRLKKYGLNIIGTVSKDKEFIPQEFLSNPKRTRHSYLEGYTDDLTLVSYVPQKCHKTIFLTSTLHQDPARSIHEKMLEMIELYNISKSDNDTIDDFINIHSPIKITQHWTVRFFLNILNVAGMAAFILKNTKDSFPELPAISPNQRKDFLFTAAEGFIWPEITRRKALYPEFQLNLKADPTPSLTVEDGPLHKKGRCQVCRQYTRKFCKKCKKHNCIGHMKIVCLQCFHNK